MATENALPTFAEEWMAQWRRAANELAEQKRLDLRSLTDEDARAATEALLELAATLPLPGDRQATSGLVIQQAILHSKRSAG
jgi:hypothetical protein